MTTHIIPVRPNPIENETAGSFLTRCCEQNGYSHLKQFVRCNFIDESRADLSSICKSYARYHEIIRSLGLSVDSHRLVCKRSISDRKYREFNDVHLPQKLFRGDLSSFCPKCLEDSAYWRKEWLLRFYLVCPQHSCALIHVCPTCKKELQLGRGELCVCDTCAQEFCNIKAPLTNADTTVWIMSKVNGADQAELDKIVAVMLVFFTLDLPNFDEIKMMVLIQSFFENRRVAAKSLAKALTEKSLDCHPRFALIPLLSANEDIRNFANEALTQMKCFGKCSVPRDFTMREACLVLNVNDETLRRIEFEGMLGTGGTNRLAKIPRGVVEQFLANIEKDPKFIENSFIEMGNESKGNLSVKKISEFLACTESYVWNLLRFGFIKYELVDIDGLSRRVARRCDVDHFKNSYFSLIELSKLWHTSASNLAGKLRMLNIHPIAGPKIDGFITHLYKASDVSGIDAKYLEDIGQRQDGNCVEFFVISAIEHLNVITVTQARSLLGVSDRRMTCILGNKSLKTFRYRSQRYVCKKSFDNFTESLRSIENISLDEVLQLSACNAATFKRRWVHSGIVTLHDYGFYKFITKDDFMKIEKMQR